MRFERVLIKMFFSKYGDDCKKRFAVKLFPEDFEHIKGAVDAIAEDEDGNSVAIEHTLIQPFSGEREDAQPFKEILEPLECDASLSPHGYLMRLALPVGAIPKGVGWIQLASATH